MADEGYTALDGEGEPIEEEEVEEEIPFGPANAKYFYQRYSYFSNYDDGIKFDEVGWWSVTPEALAQHTAERFYESLGPNALVIDAMTGVGGNSIQLAKKFHLTWAFDIDRERLDLAKHNAKICGVDEYIDFICADYTCIAPHWRAADGVFISPPWGGPNYTAQPIFDLTTIVPNMFELFKINLRLTKNIALLLPRHTNRDQLAALAKMVRAKERTDYQKKKDLICPPPPKKVLEAAAVPRGKYDPPLVITCCTCKILKLVSDFSTNQQKKMEDQKCKACVKANQPSHKQIEVVVTPPAPVKRIVVEELEPFPEKTKLEIEEMYLQNRFRMITAYFGDLVCPLEESEEQDGLEAEPEENDNNMRYELDREASQRVLNFHLGGPARVITTDDPYVEDEEPERVHRIKLKPTPQNNHPQPQLPPAAPQPLLIPPQVQVLTPPVPQPIPQTLVPPPAPALVAVQEGYQAMEIDTQEVIQEDHPNEVQEKGDAVKLTKNQKRKARKENKRRRLNNGDVKNV